MRKITDYKPVVRKKNYWNIDYILQEIFKELKLNLKGSFIDISIIKIIDINKKSSYYGIDTPVLWNSWMNNNGIHTGFAKKGIKNYLLNEISKIKWE